MAEHIRIKCKNEIDYTKARLALDMSAIEYYQKSPNKVIHLCGLEKEKDVEKALARYHVKHFKLKTDRPDFDKIATKFDEEKET